jgi:hypothetical protein
VETAVGRFHHAAANTHSTSSAIDDSAMNRDAIGAKVIMAIGTVYYTTALTFRTQIRHCYSINVINQFFNSNFSIDIIQVI